MEKVNELTILGVDHPAVAAEDVELLANWYCNVLGYEKWFHQQNERHPKAVWMLKAPDGTLLEIMPKDDTLRAARTTWTPGWSHVAFRVADLDEAVRYLDTVGIEWISEMIEAIGGGKVRSARDPDGNMIQLLERRGL